MKKPILLLLTILSLVIFYACPFGYPSRDYPNAYFPDSIVNMASLNSPYDDINMDLMMKISTSFMIFSSNRNSQGVEYDVVGDIVSFVWDETNGNFSTDENLKDNLKYFNYLLREINTTSDEYGPYGLAYHEDLFLFYANNSEGTNDIYFYTYEDFNNNYTGRLVDSLINGPFKVEVLSTNEFNEGYLSLHTNKMPYDDYNRFNHESDTINIIFCSDSLGQMDIYSYPLNNVSNASEMFWHLPVEEKEFLSAINSEYNDRCPNVCGNFMVFSSDRPGGLGGYDFYYSIFKDGQWSQPINFGAPINSEYDEYRALAIKSEKYENDLLIFSSNRPGGAGGFDIYYTGIDLMPESSTQRYSY